MMADLGLVGPQILLNRSQFQAGLGIGFDERFVVLDNLSVEPGHFRDLLGLPVSDLGNPNL